jgi:hypothetical protein
MTWIRAAISAEEEEEVETVLEDIVVERKESLDRSLGMFTLICDPLPTLLAHQLSIFVKTPSSQAVGCRQIWEPHSE